MELPVNLKNSLEEFSQKFSQANLVKSAQNISQNYRDKFGSGNKFVLSNEDVIAYSIVRMPATFGAIKTALEKIKEIYSVNFESVLDIGSGTGSAIWATIEEFEDIKNMTCVERESNMIWGAKALTQKSEFVKKVSWINEDIQNLKLTQNYDLVVAGYSLNELPKNTRQNIIQTLWEHTNKVLLIVEPGTPEAYAQMMDTRENLLSLGGKIIAPCPHINNCPVKSPDWCNFTCRISRSKLHKILKGGDAPYEDEKFTYLAFAKEEFKKENSSRILRHPIIETGKVTLKLCSPCGIETKIITKKDKELFKKAKKSNCGYTF